MTILPRKKSIAFIWLLVLLCYLVPYFVLSHVNAWYGSFLFWTLIGLLVIVFNIVATRDFKQENEQ